MSHLNLCLRVSVRDFYKRAVIKDFSLGFDGLITIESDMGLGDYWEPRRNRVLATRIILKLRYILKL
jgi:hypothetical protein